MILEYAKFGIAVGAGLGCALVALAITCILLFGVWGTIFNIIKNITKKRKINMKEGGTNDNNGSPEH